MYTCIPSKITGISIFIAQCIFADDIKFHVRLAPSTLTLTLWDLDTCFRSASRVGQIFLQT